MKDFKEFLSWEKSSKDSIDFKRIYADMAGDTLAGLVLSQIVYWHIPDKQGQSKLRVERDGHKWIACSRAEWWESTRLTPRQIDRVVQILEDKNLIIKALYKFAGSPTVHIRINFDIFIMSHNSHLANPLPNPYASDKPARADSDLTDSLNGFYANGEMDFTQTVKSLTENTAKITTEKKDSPLPPEGESEELALMKEAVRKNLKQHKASQVESIAKSLLRLHSTNGKDAEKNLYRSISISELEAFCVWWDKKKDRDGNKLTRPKNQGSVLNAVTDWLDIVDAEPPKTAQNKGAGVVWGYVPYTGPDPSKKAGDNGKS